MRSIQMLFVVLIFSTFMSILTHSGLMYSQYYESGIVNAYNTTGNLPDNITTISETQQYAATMNIFGIITSTVTFNWLDPYIPYELKNGLNPFVSGFTLIATFLISITIIEMFLKYRGIIS